MLNIFVNVTSSWNWWCHEGFIKMYRIYGGVQIIEFGESHVLVSQPVTWGTQSMTKWNLIPCQSNICLVAQSCLTVCDPMDCSPPHSSVRGISRKNPGVGCHFLLWGFFQTQGSNLCLLPWQADSLPLSHLGSPIQSIVQAKISLIHHWKFMPDYWICSTVF